MERRYLGIKELSEYIGIKVNTIYSWVSQKKIPHKKIGRLVRFDLIEINPWIESKSVDVYSKY